MAHLSAANAVSFTALKDRLKATDGNLSVQLRKLGDAGYVTLEKGFLNRRPLTTVRLTAAGRDALHAYLSVLDELVKGIGQEV